MYIVIKLIIQLSFAIFLELLTEDESGGTKLFLAAKDNLFKETQQLLKSAKALGILQTLIERATNMGNTPLYISSFHGRSNIVKILLEENALIDKANIKLQETVLQLVKCDLQYIMNANKSIYILICVGI